MSGTTWNEARPGIWEGRFRDANEFLRALDPSSALWQDAPDDWIFRGHGDSDWLLEPKAHREEEWKALVRVGEAPLVPSATPEGVRMTKEGELLQAFLEALEAAGVQVPLEYRMFGGVPGVGSEKPLALAQHYGLPTRLLDWTRHAAVAAYFACLRPAAPTAELAVWALHGSYVSSNPTEAATCRVFQTSRYDNPNLHAQDGLFTLAGLAPGTGLDVLDLPRIDDILSNVASGALPARDGALPTPNPIMRKFILPRDQDERLMDCLHRRRVTASRIFPGLAGVAMTVRERARFGVKRPRF